jgi:hypothetical protein
VIDGVAALLDAANGLFGWRSFLGAVGGALVAGALYLVHPPTDGNIRPLVALVAGCYLIGVALDLAASRARRRSVP